MMMMMMMIVSHTPSGPTVHRGVVRRRDDDRSPGADIR